MVAQLPQPVASSENVSELPNATRRVRGIKPRETLPPPAVFVADSELRFGYGGDQPLLESIVAMHRRLAAVAGGVSSLS